MKIALYNTLKKQKEDFKPDFPNEVRMYNCGPTVYFFAHIGNMRAYIFADTLKRALSFAGFKVKQVINITDVGHLTGDSDNGQDKIEESAKNEGKTASEITNFYEEAFHRDLKDLNVDTEGTLFPKASEHIEEQIELIKILEEKGFAYKTSDGIYFDTSKFGGYGKLGNIKIENQKEGARVETNQEKKNPSDFALWKFSNQNEKRLQEWDSLWGVGFPGWHVECSAMSRKYLDQPFDIHTGGIDHIPVHHNNEIAQSEAAYGAPLANYWLHNEFISVEGEKMSKSLGNTYTISDLKKKSIHPLSFRLWVLSGHYRSPMNFTWEAVLGAQNSLEKLVSIFEELPEGEEDKEIISEFENFIGDDLDTPRALALLHKAFDLKKSKRTIEIMDRVFGIDFPSLSKKMREVSDDEVMKLKADRDNARASKDWSKSDELRDKIEKEGYVLEDIGESSKIRRTLAGIV